MGLGNSPLWVGVQGPGLPGPLHGVGPQKVAILESNAVICDDIRCVPRLSYLHPLACPVELLRTIPDHTKRRAFVSFSLRELLRI